jgi:hypothetical protein
MMRCAILFRTIASIASRDSLQATRLRIYRGPRTSEGAAGSLSFAPVLARTHTVSPNMQRCKTSYRPLWPIMAPVTLRGFASSVLLRPAKRWDSDPDLAAPETLASSNGVLELPPLNKAAYQEAATCLRLGWFRRRGLVPPEELGDVEQFLIEQGARPLPCTRCWPVSTLRESALSESIVWRYCCRKRV